MKSPAVDVVVVGAGVVGLSTAVCLAEAGLAVRVDTARPPSDTTSVAAGATWEPYLVRPRDQVRTWAEASLREFARLARDSTTGVRMVEGTQQSRVPCELPYWAELVDARVCTPGELYPGFRTGWRYTAPVVDAPRYLDYLTRRLRDAGGRMVLVTYTSLAEVALEALVVVNCSGIGARTLVPDPLVEPLKGQLVVVRNPGIDAFFCDDTSDIDVYTYIYPHPDTVSLGGSQVLGAHDLTPSRAVARDIVDRCAEFEPRLRDAEILEHRVGLRPMRPLVRLEEEPLAHGGRLLHNYGHGGAGFTLAWGCARAVAAMVTGD
jgi:D-amino-acid oxidase